MSGSGDETRIQRLVGRPWFWVLAITVLAAVPLVKALRRTVPEPPPVLTQLPPLALTNGAGAPADLAGVLWVACFVRAATTPDPATDALAPVLLTVQHRLRNLGGNVRFIAIALDPAPPGRAALEALAFRHHLNPRAWTFLEGPPATVAAAASALLGEPVAEATLARVLDAPRLVLVDPRGAVRGRYDTSEDGQDALVYGAGVLANQPEK